MRFSIISPVAGLEKYATQSKTHLTLAHVDNPIYWQFYRQRSEDGDLVILDNSAYEGKMDVDLIVDRIGRSHPKVVALPDILNGDAQKSCEIGLNFFEAFKKAFPVEWMFIPQLSGRSDWNNCWKSIDLMIQSHGIKWIGIPRAFVTDHDIQRTAVCEMIKEKYPNVYVHALGMCDGSLLELQLLTDAGCDGCDSSAPVWRGWNGYSLFDEGEMSQWRIQGTPCDFSIHPNSLNVANEQVIQNNLKGVLDRCKV